MSVLSALCQSYVAEHRLPVHRHRILCLQVKVSALRSGNRTSAPSCVTGKSWREVKADRISQSIDHCMDFGAGPAFARFNCFRVCIPHIHPRCVGGRGQLWNQSSRTRCLPLRLPPQIPVATPLFCSIN